MNVIEDYITNVDEIIELVKQHDHLFELRENHIKHGNHMGMRSKFKTLFDSKMTAELKEAIISNFPKELQVNLRVLCFIADIHLHEKEVRFRRQPHVGIRHAGDRSRPVC